MRTRTKNLIGVALCIFCSTAAGGCARRGVAPRIPQFKAEGGAFEEGAIPRSESLYLKEPPEGTKSHTAVK